MTTISTSRQRLGFVFALIAGLMVWACGQEDGASGADELSLVDGVLSELGGLPTAELTRGQRWRMISSMGSGLPPSSFRAEDLPEPDSRGAKLVEAYCVQCHWLPVPSMHTATEWPVLLRRMLMRAGTLKDRMGGPITSERLGEILMTGMATVPIPSSEDADTLLAYLQRHAIEAAEPGEIGEGPYRAVFIEHCSICHETPAPGVHSGEEWAELVGRMRANMALMDVRPLTDRQREEITSYLESQVEK